MQPTPAAAPAPNPASTPAPANMQVDTGPPPSEDIASAVRLAREELAAVIHALTQVLSAVAESDPPPLLEKPVAAQQQLTEVEKLDREAAQKKREAVLAELKKRRSLAPVLARFDALRAAVDAAVTFRKNLVDRAEKDENDVSPDDKALLLEKRAHLVDQVRAKNDKIKILVDHLRELHSDIVALLAPYIKARPPSHGRKS